MSSFDSHFTVGTNFYAVVHISLFSCCQYMLLLPDGTSKAFVWSWIKVRLIQIPAFSGIFCFSLEQAHAASLYLHC